jgi:tRNA pseudouridine55 synthase
MQRKTNRYDPDIPAGILAINKPEGLSSAQVVAKVKRALNAKKVGHTGTLDPFATGIVICCINQATKLSQFFLQGDKTYEAILHLGISTDTQDKTGKVIAQEEPKCNEYEISAAFKLFTGTIEQFPPVYSALKHKGVPLYRLARKGQPVQKPSRKVHIHELIIQSIHMPFVAFSVKCSSGTYIRTLCADIGQKLECGGHLNKLCRIESCGYTIEETLTYEQIDTHASTGNLHASIIPVADALKNIPKIVATPEITKRIFDGRAIFRSNFSQDTLDQGNILQIITSDNILLAVIQCQQTSDECKVIRMGLSKKLI